MKYIDLTHTLKNKINTYPEDPEFKIKYLDKEDYTLSEISGGLHSGTHIDAPYHYIKNGEKVNTLKLYNLIGKSSVLTINNIQNSKKILVEDLNFKNPLEKIIIIKTYWCNNWGCEEYFYKNPYLSKELAKFIVENNVKGIAIDTGSVDKYNQNKIHKILLKNDVWIVENIRNTEKLTNENYTSYFIPLKIEAEASFVRAFVKK